MAEWQKPAEGPALTSTQRELADALSKNPLDLVQQDLRGYLESLFLQLLTPQLIRGLVGQRYVVGDYRIISKDLTAQTGVYIYEDDLGQFLYGNGAAASQTTYADLYAFWGANAWGADAGGNFLLPDCRGRSLFFCGTNAAADLGDNDGVAEASRQAKHAPAHTITITGAPGLGTLAVSPASHDHTYFRGSYSLNAATGTVVSTILSENSTATGGTSLSVAGAPSIGTLAISGGVGSGMTGDGPAHLFVGSLLVRF